MRLSDRSWASTSMIRAWHRAPPSGSGPPGAGPSRGATCRPRPIFWRRAYDLPPDGDPARLALVRRSGRGAAGARRVRAGERGAATSRGAAGRRRPGLRRIRRARPPRPAVLSTCNAGDEEGWSSRARAEVERRSPIFEAARNDVGLATAWRVRWQRRRPWRFGSMPASRPRNEIIRHAELPQDMRQQRRGRGCLRDLRGAGPDAGRPGDRPLRGAHRQRSRETAAPKRVVQGPSPSCARCWASAEARELRRECSPPDARRAGQKRGRRVDLDSIGSGRDAARTTSDAAEAHSARDYDGARAAR